MTLKKLSIAAALSIGVMTMGGIAIAKQLGDLYPQPRAIMEQPCPTGAACPVSPSMQMIPQEPCLPNAIMPLAQPLPMTGAACPVCPQENMGLQHVYSSALMPVPAANPIAPAMSCAPIGGCCPNIGATARVLERQAFAFPDIGDAGLVIPKGKGLLQIGGDEEAMAISTSCPSGLTVVPSRGPILNLMSKDSPEGFTSGAFAPYTAAYPGITGAAAPWSAAGPISADPSVSCCPLSQDLYSITGAAAPALNNYPCQGQFSLAKTERVTQGVEILRCGIPKQNALMQAYFNSPCFREAGVLGAAVPINPCQTAAPCPVVPSSPCNPCPTGQAAPIIEQSPCAPIAPCDPCTGGAAPIIPAMPAIPAVPAVPLSSLNNDDNLVPVADVKENSENVSSSEVQCDHIEPCPTGKAAPISKPKPKQVKPCPVKPSEPEVCPIPCPTGSAVPPCPVQPCAPVAQPCDPCTTGLAAPMAPVTQYFGPRKIQTSSGIQMQKNVLIPVTVPVTITEPTGCACPVMSQYPDVSNNMLAGCDINKLTAQGILAGYPDRTFKPNLPIMRDEFASAMISALELQNVPDFQQQIFKDVPKNHWANKDIDKAFNRGLMAGYPGSKFNPDKAVTRAEALSTMGKVIPCDISAAEAQQILSCYSDAKEIPGWATISVAEALKSGLIKNLPGNDQVRPNASASRAEVASMIGELRQTLGLEPTPQTTGAATQLQPGIATSTIPTLKVKFEDIISARTSEIGDRFVAKTIEPVSIDGQLYPAGSEVHGKVVEVIRPGFGEAGAIRVAFNELRYECSGSGNLSTTLPSDIISAVVVKEDAPNIIGRVLGMPFSLPGKVAGVTARTVGGVVITAGNMVETFLTNTANGNNELANLEAPAAGRSYLRALADIPQGIWYTGKTLGSGTLGVVKVTGDELAYVVSPDGHRIAQINPDEVLSVAFGCK